MTTSTAATSEADTPAHVTNGTLRHFYEQQDGLWQELERLEKQLADKQAIIGILAEAIDDLTERLAAAEQHIDDIAQDRAGAS